MDSGQPPSANDHPTKLLVVLGDQLAQPHPVQETLHPSRDALWMAEVPGESLHVPSHAARTVMFLSAMRHFARRQREDGWALHYHALGDHGHHTLESALEADLRRLRPREVQVLQPGEVRVQRELETACRRAGVTLTILPDPLFLVSLEAFSEWAGTRKQLRMEYFYRDQRRRLDVLMDDGEPPAASGTSTPRTGGISAAKVPAYCPHRDASRPTPSRARSSRSSPSSCPTSPAAARTSTGQSHPRMRARRWTISSPTGCHTSVSTRTRCGAASPGCTTPACPPP